MSNLSSARAALEKFNYRMLLGKPMRIMLRRDDPTDRESGRANLFVKNIPKSFTEANLYAKFRTIGPVLSVKVSSVVCYFLIKILHAYL